MTYEMDGQNNNKIRFDTAQVAIAKLIFENGYLTDEGLISTLSSIKNMKDLKTFLEHYKFKTIGNHRRLR